MQKTNESRSDKEGNSFKKVESAENKEQGEETAHADQEFKVHCLYHLR